jgi:hypothetical protein
MLKTQFISQIYWPDFLMDQKERGFLIGWNMENFQCCITNFVIIPEASFFLLQQTLSTIDDENLLWLCSKTDSKPIVLGEWIPTMPDDYTPPLAYQREGIWLTLTSRKSGPLLHSLYSCGCLHRTSCHMIRYKSVQARQLHSFSVHPSEEVGASSASPSDGPVAPPHKTDLAYAIFQINNAENLGAFIWESFPFNEKATAAAAEHDRPNLLGENTADSNSCSSETDMLLPSTSSSSDNVSDSPPRLSGWVVLTLYGSYLWLSYLSLLQALLETPLYSAVMSLLTKLLPCISPRAFLSAPRFIRSASLKDISITSAHFCERSRLLWHCLYTSIDFASKSSVSEVKSRRKQWIFVYSRLIFICIDILLGVMLGLYLWGNRRSLLVFFHEIGAYVQDKVILGNLEFLNDTPYGIKFNQLLTERLSLLLGKSIVALSSGYNYFIRESCEEYLIIAISLMGCFGFSFQMLLVVDIIRSLTVHISIIHMTLSMLHYFQLKSLSTLFYLFQGKKKNYLRKRIDTLETNKSQLFFGTVYFTVIFFLFPTFATYFFLFTMLQFCVVMLQAVLWSCSIGVKEFPWCELYLYFRHPHVLSQGVRIDIDYIRSSKKIRDTPTSNHKVVVDRKETKRAKKDLLKETLKRENGRMLTESVRKRGEFHDEHTRVSAAGESKVKFSDDVQTFPYHINAASENLGAAVKENTNTYLLPVAVGTTHGNSKTSASHDFTPDNKVIISNLQDFQRVQDVEESVKSGEGVHVDGVEDEGEGEGEGDESSVVSNSSDDSSCSSSSSSSSSDEEEIGWARCHSEDDGDTMMMAMDDDSIFAMENIWGSSDGMEHDLLKGKNDESPPLPPPLPPPPNGETISAAMSLSINVPEFSYCSPNEHPGAPLSPLVNRYSPTKHESTEAFYPISSCTTYLSIQPSSQPFFHHLLKPYYPYFSYWSKKKSVIRVFRGLIKGNPALDLQIIRAAVEISSSSLRVGRAVGEGREELSGLQSQSLSLSLSPRGGAGRKAALATSTSSRLLPPPVPSSSSSSSSVASTSCLSPAMPVLTTDGRVSYNHSHSSDQGGNDASPEINSVSRSPNVFDLWSLLLGTCNIVFSIDKRENISMRDVDKLIFIHGVQSNRNVKKRKLEKFLFCFLLFTISLCLLVALLGLCYACSPIISGLISKFGRLIIKVIKRSKVSNVPQKGIFDITKVHSFFSHAHH